MERRRKTNAAEEIMDLVAMWWVGVALAVVSDLVLSLRAARVAAAGVVVTSLQFRAETQLLPKAATCG